MIIIYYSSYPNCLPILAIFWWKKCRAILRSRTSASRSRRARASWKVLSLGSVEGEQPETDLPLLMLWVEEILHQAG